MGSDLQYWTLPVEARQNVRTLEDLIPVAIREWYDQEAGRYDSSRAERYRAHKPMTAHQAERVIDDCSSRNGTEQANVIPIISQDSIRVTTKKVSVRVPGSVLAGHARGDWDSKHALAKQVRAEHGDAVKSIKVVKTPAARKPVAVATKGATKTVYQVFGRVTDFHGKAQETLLVNDCATQADARAEALRLAGEKQCDKFESFAVRGIVKRDSTDDDALVTITRPVADEVTITVEATIETVKADPKIDHYLVTFWYHH